MNLFSQLNILNNGNVTPGGTWKLHSYPTAPLPITLNVNGSDTVYYANASLGINPQVEFTGLAIGSYVFKYTVMCAGLPESSLLTIDVTAGPGNDCNIGGANLSITYTATSATIYSDTGTDATIDGATAYSAGLLTATLYTKLIGLGTYIHNQPIASNTWVVTHNLNRYPSVTIVDSGGTVFMGDIQYDSTNQLTILLNPAFAGKAYLN